MKEWVAYYKQHEAIILFIAAWLLSIPTGIFIIRLDDYLKNRSLTAKERKVKALLTHYREVVKHNAKSKFDSDDMIPVFMKVAFFPIAIALVMLLSVNTFKDVLGDRANIFIELVYFAMFPFLVYAMILGPRVTLMVIDSIRFDEYRSKTVVKLKKLGGNPEELDEIDKEIEAEKQGD